MEQGQKLITCFLKYEALETEFQSLKTSHPNPQKIEDILNKKETLIAKIAKENGFLFVNFGTTFYPDKEHLYTTIDIVDKNQPERMRFVNHEEGARNPKQLKSKKPDLIDQMIQYNDLETALIMAHKLNPNDACPVYHCVGGFEHRQLKPYLAVFNQGVVHHKKLIMDTLNHDKDPERRAAAAFLVGHFQKPEEIIAVLSPHVVDKDEVVRNNVMRVIGATLQKSKITHIDVTPYISLLDSPFATDRNKALYVLDSVAVSPETKRLILQKAGDKLLALLQLKQPNNHEYAYKLLMKISGKNYDSHHQSSWKKWIHSAQNQVG